MKEFDEFVSIMKRLRTECPWDREQTHESLKKHFIEETYEAIDAIDRKHYADLRGELGDVALQIVFHAIIAEEERLFTLEEVFAEITQKLIRRHPHVFGEAVVHSSGDQSALWDKIKMEEGRNSVLEGVPRHLPALMKAEKVQKKAAKVGFDWKVKEEVWRKVEEELNELQHAAASGDQSEVKKEFGDVLFSLVNYARFIGVEPEDSLHASIQKFMERFHFIEQTLKEQKKEIRDTGMEELDALWNEAKKMR